MDRWLAEEWEFASICQPSSEEDYSDDCHPCAGRGPDSIRRGPGSRLRGNDRSVCIVRSDIQELRPHMMDAPATPVVV